MLVLFMEVLFLKVTGSVILGKLRFARDRSPMMADVMIRIWFEVKIFLFLSR